MKKNCIFVPLITIFLLVSCNNGGGDDPKPEVSTLPTKCYLYQNIAKEICLVAEEQYEYNDKGLLVKSVDDFSYADVIEINEYEYDDKNNVTKNTYTHKEDKIITDVSHTTFIYTYDEKDRILKKIEHKENSEDVIDEYTYESDLIDWDSHKHSDNGGATYNKDIVRTFKDGLYEKAVDSKNNEYYYYTWDEYRCNTKIETYEGEEKTPLNHSSDETYEYHKNMSNKIKQYVLSYYSGGVIESNKKTLVEYDGYDRVTKISNFDEQNLNSYMVYEYPDNC